MNKITPRITFRGDWPRTVPVRTWGHSNDLCAIVHLIQGSASRLRKGRGRTIPLPPSFHPLIRNLGDVFAKASPIPWWKTSECPNWWFENTLSFPGEETSLGSGLPSHLALGDAPCPSSPSHGFLQHTIGTLNNAMWFLPSRFYGHLLFLIHSLIERILENIIGCPDNTGVTEWCPQNLKYQNSELTWRFFPLITRAKRPWSWRMR